jgi:creatinine amidohydrolase
MMNLYLQRESGARITQALAKGLVDKAILVTGATENHGNHLPYGSDTLTPWAIAEKVAKRVEKLILLPPVPYGMSMKHLGFPLTISIQPETLTKFYFDIFDSLAKSKINKIIVINGHDGNIMSLRHAALRLRMFYPQAVVYSFELWGVRLEEIFGPGRGAGHAGEIETSVLLYLHPDLVDMDSAEGAPLEAEPIIWTNRWMVDQTSSGAIGEPRYADSSKGEAAIQHSVDFLVKWIQANA